MFSDLPGTVGQWLLQGSIGALWLGVAMLMAETVPFLRRAPRLLQVGWLFVLLRLAAPPNWYHSGWLPAGIAFPVFDAWSVEQAGAPVGLMLCLAIWMIGVGVFSSAIMVFQHRWRREIEAQTLTPPPALLRRLWRLARCCGLSRPPALLISQQLQTPLVLGAPLWRRGGRALIVLPANFCLPSRRQSLDLALAHELLHLRYRDSWWLGLALTIKVLFWFHPLAWLACRRVRAWSEYACDHALVRCFPRHRQAYRKLLLAQLARLNGLALPFNQALALSDSDELRRCRVLSEPSPARLSIVLTVSLITACTALSFSRPILDNQSWIKRQTLDAMPGSLAKQYWLRAHINANATNAEARQKQSSK